jgi:hypothetical protein
MGIGEVVKGANNQRIYITKSHAIENTVNLVTSICLFHGISLVPLPRIVHFCFPGAESHSFKDLVVVLVHLRCDSNHT